MNLILVMLFGGIAVALVARDFGRRESMLCVLLAVAITVLFYVRPNYMT